MAQLHPSPPANLPAPGSDKAVRWIAGTIIAALVIVYAGSFRVPALLDDGLTFANNPSIRSLSALATVLLPPPAVINAGRPLANLTFAVNYAFSGSDPYAYHIVNLCLHVLSALLLFGVVRRTLLLPALARLGRTVAFGVAGFAALIWGLHPALTQCVTYISQRTEELVALFSLLALYCFVRGVTSRARAWHAGAVVCCFLGTLSKEVGVTLPLLLWLYDRTFVTGSFRAALRSRPCLYPALAASWVVTAWLMLDLGRRGVGPGLGVSPVDYALTQCKAVGIYLGLGFWPHPLIFDRGTAVLTSLSQAWPFALLLGLLLVAVARVWWRSPALGFAPAVFFLLLAPASSVVPVVGATIAENRLYLPLAAGVTISVLGVYHLFGARRAQLICGAVAVAAAVGTVSRNRAYASEIGLWTDTVEKAPDNPRAHGNLGVLLAARPDLQLKALNHFATALQLQPDYAEVHYNMAVLLATQPGRKTEALEHYAAAIRIKRDYFDAHHNLGILLAGTLGREADAVPHLSEAIRGFSIALSERPRDETIHLKLANLLARMPGRQVEAGEHYAAALRLKPNQAEAHGNLAAILAGVPGRRTEAVAHYREALRIQPDLASAHNNLAVLLAADSTGRSEALLHYCEALRLQPDYADAHNNLGNLLADSAGRQAEAVSHYQAAIRLVPENVAAHHNLALLLAAQPERQAEAMAHFLEAVRLMPQNPTIHLNFARFLEAIPAQKAAAEAHYSRALSLDPSLAAARAALTRLRP